jgi:Helix-turn-helix of DDE superfamily endonuclease
VRQSTKTSFTTTKGSHAFLPCSAAAVVPNPHLRGVIRRHRASIGSSWRKLNPGKQALLVLVYLRKGETFDEIAAGFEVSMATACGT